jgi:riboflavin kinase/FMN adenylyltransferase
MVQEQKLLKGGVCALGNFDGVHRGHRLLIESALKSATVLKTKTYVLTFEPHPRRLFQPNAAPFRLTPFPLKERLLKSLGVDEVIALPFTKEFSEISAQGFVDKILIQDFAVQHVVAGYDFTYGHNRSGDMKKLAAYLGDHHIGVTEIEALGDKGEIFSSTRIRRLLEEGDVEGASNILGHPWSIVGTVIKGEQRGRTIGVPTANITLGETLRPRFGVYAIEARRVGEKLSHRGVANIGTRPTVDGQSETLEAHLFDFDQDMYGQEWEFALTRFIRAEQKFEDFGALKEQIYKDIELAKASSSEALASHHKNL